MEGRGITYRMLADSIAQLDDSHKDDNISIYDPARDEFFPVTGMQLACQPGFSKNDGDGILDKNCLFLFIPTE